MKLTVSYIVIAQYIMIVNQSLSLKTSFLFSIEYKEMIVVFRAGPVNIPHLRTYIRTNLTPMCLSYLDLVVEKAQA